MLIRKTWDDGFADKVGGWGILRNGGILIIRDMILKWGVRGGLISFYELCFHNTPDTLKSKTDKKESLKLVEEAVPQKWLRSGS